MAHHVELTDTNGVTWIGDSIPSLTDDDRETLHDLLKNFKALDFVSLEVMGAKTYFNPAHIVSVSLHEDVE